MAISPSRFTLGFDRAATSEAAANKNRLSLLRKGMRSAKRKGDYKAALAFSDEMSRTGAPAGTTGSAEDAASIARGRVAAREALSSQMRSAMASTREGNIAAAKAAGTFDATREKFNKANTGKKVMDEAGNISDAPQTPAPVVRLSSGEIAAAEASGRAAAAEINKAGESEKPEDLMAPLPALPATGAGATSAAPLPAPPGEKPAATAPLPKTGPGAKPVEPSLPTPAGEKPAAAAPLPKPPAAPQPAAPRAAAAASLAPQTPEKSSDRGFFAPIKDFIFGSPSLSGGAGASDPTSAVAWAQRQKAREDFNMGKIAARAKGGPVKAGKPYLVGEEGPEIVVPKEDGEVIPNDKLRKKSRKTLRKMLSKR